MVEVDKADGSGVVEDSQSVDKDTLHISDLDLWHLFRCYCMYIKLIRNQALSH